MYTNSSLSPNNQSVKEKISKAILEQPNCQYSRELVNGMFVTVMCVVAYNARECLQLPLSEGMKIFVGSGQRGKKGKRTMLNLRLKKGNIDLAVKGYVNALH